MSDMKTLTINGTQYTLDLTEGKKQALTDEILDSIPDGDEVSY